jgi:hypothetical protein
MNAYIDEYGNTDISIHKDGVTEYYILTAILIENDKEYIVTKRLDEISTKYFSNGEIKSSNIGKNHDRRFKILDEVIKLDFFAISLVVKKELLYGEGFQYKKVFVKFINGLLYTMLVENYKDINIYHDEYGRDSFMMEFEKYINNKVSEDLFSELGTHFIKSNNNRIIQLADFISGTLAKAFDTSDVESRNYYSKISQLKIHVEEWPREIYKQVIIPEEGNENQLIEKVSINTVIDYIEKYRNSNDHDIKLQVSFLKYLFNTFMYISKYKYVYTFELRKYLEYFSNNISNYQIRHNIVAPLRDYGIPIVSTKQGYKIPCCKDDITKFISLGRSIINPMLHRIKSIKDKYYLSTYGKIDLNNGYGIPKEWK